MIENASHGSMEVDSLYRSIVESTQEGIWIVDEALRTTFANAAMATMLDTTVDDLIGSSLLDWMDDDERKIAEASLHRRW
jgi:PAS domain S-box-containing protein